MNKKDIRRIGIVLIVLLIMVGITIFASNSVNRSSETIDVETQDSKDTLIGSGNSQADLENPNDGTKDKEGQNSDTTETGDLNDEAGNSNDSNNEEGNLNDSNVEVGNSSDSANGNTQVTLTMVGDVLLHTPVSDSGLMADGSYDYHHLFANVKSDIESADIALVNQEVILGGTELGLSGYPAFNGAYEVGDALVNAGFDVVLHATNHALDKGRKGIENCLNYWSGNHPQIGVVGINGSAEQQNTIYIKEVKGIKIAILNYTYGTNGIAMPSGMLYAVNLLDKEKIAQDVSIAKANADFVVVCPHWGTEYTHTENTEQTEYAMYFAELGVDLVIGTHPHVIQPVKWIETSSGHRMLVYYSIGNFINATSEYGRGVADRMIGAMANVTIEKSSDGTVKIADYSVTPLVTQMLSGTGAITTYKLSDYSPELASQNEIIGRDDAFSYEYCVNLCDEVFAGVQQNR